MGYYTERHGMRTPIERTYTISIDMYTLLYDCCERYFNNIAWKFPLECPDGRGYYGLNLQKFNAAMKFEIPTLFRGRDGMITIPEKRCSWNGDDKYDQYALLDLIELIAKEARDISDYLWHSHFSHYDFSFRMSNTVVVSEFTRKINSIFVKTGLQYRLKETGIIERIVDNMPILEEFESQISLVPEEGLRDLLSEAIILFKTPNPKSHRNSVEKLWDAFERLKTYYTEFDKKKSADRIVNDIAKGNDSFRKLIDEEFFTLTRIGNGFRIRHHETNKAEITDLNYCDYLFSRCLALIALAIKYLN